MGKIINGVVLDDDLFREYHKKAKNLTKRKSSSYFIIIKTV